MFGWCREGGIGEKSGGWDCRESNLPQSPILTPRCSPADFFFFLVDWMVLHVKVVKKETFYTTDWWESETHRILHVVGGSMWSGIEIEYMVEN